MTIIVVKPGEPINAAAQRAQPGDTVLVKAGVYRERVAPARGGTKNKPITYKADGEVVIKGSDEWQPKWRKTGPHNRPVYVGEIGNVEAFHTRLKQAPNGKRMCLGQIFVDGEQLREVDTLDEIMTTPKTWRRSNQDRNVVVHAPSWEPLENCLVEATVRDRVFAPHKRGLSNIHVIGFTMEHCANQFPDRFWNSDSLQAGMLGCRAGHHWLIKDCTIRHAKSIGIDCGYEGQHDLEGNQPTPNKTGYHTIIGCQVYGNGCCGIAGMHSPNTTISLCHVWGNNWNEHTAPEVGGIKLHFFKDGRINDNWISHNEAYGIWIDNSYQDVQIDSNEIMNNRGAGIMIELGWRSLAINNNVIGYSRPNWHATPRADGIYLQDASGVHVFDNTIIGCQRYGIHGRVRTERDNAACSNVTIDHNVIQYNSVAAVNMPYSGPRAEGNVCRNNMYSPGSRFILNPWGGEDDVLKKVRGHTGRWNEQLDDGQVGMNESDWNKCGYS